MLVKRAIISEAQLLEATERKMKLLTATSELAYVADPSNVRWGTQNMNWIDALGRITYITFREVEASLFAQMIAYIGFDASELIIVEI